MRFQTVKNRFPTAHINKPAGTVMDNRNYIRKEGKWTETAKAETRVEGTFVEFGTPPTKGEENSPKMHQLLRNVKEGLSTTEIVEETPSFCLQTQKIDQLRDNLKSEPFSKQFRELEVHYLFGASGAGKTRSIFRKHEIQDICRITDYGGRNGVRFDGYHTQPVLVFEEFHSQIPIESMLIFWIRILQPCQPDIRTRLPVTPRSTSHPTFLWKPSIPRFSSMIQKPDGCFCGASIL